MLLEQLRHLVQLLLVGAIGVEQAGHGLHATPTASRHARRIRLATAQTADAVQRAALLQIFQRRLEGSDHAQLKHTQKLAH